MAVTASCVLHLPSTGTFVAKGEYVVGAVHTNTIERFWSLVKRGMIRTFHKVSKKVSALYVAEFQFQYQQPRKCGTAHRSTASPHGYSWSIRHF
jgi:hypothetical protein